MRPRLGTAAGALLAFATAALYLPRLQDAPVYPQRDEMYFALTAHSIAFTGHDPSGMFMPVYFPIGPIGRPLMWFQPMLMYAIAGVVRILPISETSVRLPMVAAAVVDIVLMYFVAKLLVDSELLAITAAVFLALTPAHFMFGRVALDYQLPLPFILGWLLCVGRYLRNPRPIVLFIAGLLLGFGLYTLIAADVLMPAYLLVTCAVLYTRRDPANRYALLVLGFLLPASLGMVFLLRHPAIIGEVVSRYQSGQPHDVGIVATLQTFLRARHAVDALVSYASFWNPRLLFIDGRGMLTGTTGVFLLPVAGAFVIGLLRALRHVNPVSMVLIVGLVTAALPASVVNEPQAVRRALEQLPFVVLLAVYGLDYLWSAESARVRGVAFLAVMATVFVAIEQYREYVPHAQAFIRAATVPVAVAALAVLLNRSSFDNANIRRIAPLALCSLAVIEVASFIAGYDTTLRVSMMVMAGLVVAALTARESSNWLRGGQLMTAALLAFVVHSFIYFYVAYPVRRVGAVPASLQLLIIQFVSAGAVLIVALWLAAALGRRIMNTADRKQFTVGASFALVVLQFAYFHIDYFGDVQLRLVHVSAVALAVIGLASVFRGADAAKVPLGHFATTALMAIAAIQFAWFYVDYFAAYRIRRSSEIEGSVRAVYEKVLEETNGIPIPAVYLAHKMEFSWVRDLYWRFYVLKHNRPDLLARTINAESPDRLDQSRIRTLPAGAVVIASASPETEIEIDRLVSAGDLRRDVLVKAADGVPAFWMLERTAGRR
jgi:dolichyl-phosphate-mannose-protein mannosyltransferase